MRPAPDDARSPPPAGRAKAVGAARSALALLVAALLGGTASCATSPAAPGAALDAAVAGAARELADELADRPGRAGLKLAVSPVETQAGGDSALVRDLLHRVGDHLRTLAPELVLIERDGLPALLREHRLAGQGGLLDRRTTAELGRLLGADALLLGELVALEGAPQLHLRVVDVETAEVYAQAARPLGLRAAVPAGETAPVGAAGTGGEPRQEAATAEGPPPFALPVGPGRFLVGDFHVALAGCGFVDVQVVCRVELRNLAPGPRRVSLLATTLIVDTHGKSYRLQRVTWPNEVEDVTASDQVAERTVEGGLEMKLDLTFSGVPRRKKKLQTVALRFAEGACDFPGVTLSRD